MQANSEALHPLIHQHGVLVVEDSDLQRMCAVSVLAKLGLGKIYEAVDGEAALELLRRPGVTPAVIMLDLEMPGMDGIELLQQIAQEGLRPSVLVVSGADHTIINSVGTMTEALGLELLGTLSKPLSYIGLSSMMARFRKQHTDTSAAKQDLRPIHDAPCVQHRDAHDCAG